MSPLDTNATGSSLFDAIRRIEPVIREHAAEAERERHLPDAVAEAMRACGLYRLFRPKAFGGLELDPITAFRAFEEVARIDSAASWNLTLANSVDAFGAWFGDEGGREIFGHPDTILAGSFFPPRRAVPVDGGYRLTGRTPFVSGAHQAKWIMGLANIFDDDAIRKYPDGSPMTLMTVCPADRAEILDTWRTLGMRGTGSHDVAMNEVFIPSRHTAVLAPYEKPGAAYQGPLYKLTAWAAISVLGCVPLGIARAAIDDLLELAAKKAPSYTATALRDRTTVQFSLGQAEATLGAARAYFYEALREVWEKALEGHMIDMPGKMKVQLAATHAAATAAQAVDLVHATAGTTGIRDEHRFQRYFRDVHTITQHGFISASRYESGGQFLLGVPIEWPFYGL